MSTENLTIVVGLQGKTLALSYPASLDEELTPFFSQFMELDGMPADETLYLNEEEEGTFRLGYRDKRLGNRLVWPSLLQALCDVIEYILCELTDDVVLRAGAVRHKGKSVLVLGPAGSHKTTLTAWFTDRGFEYLADNFVVLNAARVSLYGERDAISPFSMPLAPHMAAQRHVLSMQAYREAYVLPGNDQVFVQPLIPEDHGTIQHCGLVVVPRFALGSPLTIEILRPDELRFQLAQAAHPARRLTSIDAARIAAFSHAVPAIAIRYGHYDQLADVLDEFTRYVLDFKVDVAGIWRFLDKWTQANTTPVSLQSGETSPVASTTRQEPGLLSATVLRYRKRLTVGMATYDDYDGVYFTLQSLRLYHPEVSDDIEFIVVDNNPDGACGTHLKALEKQIPHYRYIPIRERSGTAVRDYVMAEAASDFVLNLDCHVLLVPGAVTRLMQYFEANPDTPDLLQGPLIYDDLTRISTHMNPVWREGMYGFWGTDERGRDPEAPAFEIPSQGLGLYACRRSAWPGYNPHFRGFGGEEGYIHEKFRQAEGRALCLPFLRWLHRFARPLGVPYPINWNDRIHNYFVGFHELGLPLEPVEAHFRELLGSSAEKLIEDARNDLARIAGR